MNKEHKCFVIKEIDPRDWRFGDGNVQIKANVPSGNWDGYFHFQESQKINGFETDDCAVFEFQQRFDAFMDFLIATGQIPQYALEYFTANGYMDSENSDDGRPHFHTSERYVAVLTGNGQNGNSFQDCYNVFAKYGMIPWGDFPFDASVTTPELYFVQPSAAMITKGQALLAYMGGKNALQYHWIFANQNSTCPFSTLDQARQLAPIGIGVAVATNWNQEEPSPVPEIGTPIQHAMANTSHVSGAPGERVLDHYVPFTKYLVPGYPIPFVSQFVLAPTFTPPPAAPVLPVSVQENPAQNIPALKKWIAALLNWLSIVSQKVSGAVNPIERARLQGAIRSTKWPKFKKEFAKTHPAVCAVCGGKKGINLHHLKPFHVFPELELDPDNVILLCNEKRHHIEVGHLGDFQSINPTGRADIELWKKKESSRPDTSSAIKVAFDK